MSDIKEPIKNVEVLDIYIKNKSNLFMRAKVDGELIEFKFKMIYRPEIKGSMMLRSKNFVEIAKYNSQFEKHIHSLIKKVYHGENLSFPLKLKFQ